MQKRISPLPHKLRHGRVSRCVLQAVLSSWRIIVVHGRGKCSRRRNRSRPKTTCFGYHSPLPSTPFIPFREKKIRFSIPKNTRIAFKRDGKLFRTTRDVPAAFETCHSSISEVHAILFGILSFYKALDSTLEPNRSNIFEPPIKLRGIQRACFRTPLISRPDLSDTVRFPPTIQF